MASQALRKEGFPGWGLEGGSLQLYIPSAATDIPEELPRLPTNWEDENE